MKKYFFKFWFILFFIITIVIFTINILVSTQKIGTYEVNRIQTNKKIVMLTFDDGPDYPDRDILNILNKEDVPGMFFQIGKNIVERGQDPVIQKLTKDMINSGSWIGSHTFNHLNYLHKNKLAVQELKQTFKLLYDFYQNLGIQINQELVPTRFGYLQNFQGMDYIGRKTGNKYFVRGYLGTDYDEEKTGKNVIIQQYLKHLKPGQIFVCHTRAYAKEWLPDLIHILKGKGYQFASFNPSHPHYYKNYGKLVI